MPIEYRNTKTGRTVLLGAPSPVMDRSDRWVRTEPDTEPDTEPEDGETSTGTEQEGATPPAPFDPDDHTVEEVNQRLAAADADERARVLAAEAGGKNRRGIVAGPHAPDGDEE